MTRILTSDVNILIADTRAQVDTPGTRVSSLASTVQARV